MLKADWNYPTAIRVGASRRHEITEVCREFGSSAPLLVTDPGLAALPLVSALVDDCRTAGLNLGVFSAVQSNPTGENVAAGIDVYRAGRHDSVIALGGGSGLDAGKAVAVAAGQSCDLWQLEDRGDNWLNAKAELIPPIFALPTTAGTGSEVGRAAVILHQQEQRKVVIFHPKMLPSVVILDPQLTLGLPPGLTAATGMDALSHNLEAYCSPLYHPLAEGIAVEGMRLIKTWLPRAVAAGADLEARTQMLVASSMGATAFQRGLGGMHALAHPLGAVYGAHHGTLNAILMPYVLQANRAVIEPSICRLANYLDLAADFTAFIDWVLALREKIGIPHALSALGIDAQRADEIGQMAVADPTAQTNPIRFEAPQYAQIFDRAVNGVL